MRATIGRQAIAAALLASVLAGCGFVGPVAQVPTINPAPTAQAGAPTAAPVTTAQPGGPTVAPVVTAQPSGPTVAPIATAQSGAPTTAPALRPAFSFEPRGGPPGTVVTVRGWDHQPNGWAGVYLGTPGPVGTALASAQADAAGRWEVRVTIPDTLPDGSPVPAQNIFLVTMDAQFRPQASAPFAYQAPPRPAPQLPPLAQARDNVQTLLVAYGTADIRPYLAQNLRRPYDQGRTLPELLGFDPLTMQGKPDIGPAQQIPGGIPAAQTSVTVRLPSEIQYYNFTLTVEDGYWKVTGAQLLRSEPVHQPFPGPGWVDHIGGDYTGDGIDERYLVRAEMPASQAGFGDPYLDHSSRPTAGVMVAQVGPHNVNVMLSADSKGVRSGEVELAAFEGVSGYLVSFDRRGPFLVYLIPLRSDGTPRAPAIILAYNASGNGFVAYTPPMDQTPASEPGRRDAVALGQLALDYTRASSGGTAPIVAGAAATAGDYALAMAQTAGGQVQFLYFKREGGAWGLLLATTGATPDELRSYGIPQNLELPQPMIDLMYGTMAYYNTGAPDRAAEGFVLFERVDGRYARVTLRDAAQGDITVYLYQSMGWEVLIAGQVFIPEELDRLGIPPSVRG